MYVSVCLCGCAYVREPGIPSLEGILVLERVGQLVSGPGCVCVSVSTTAQTHLSTFPNPSRPHTHTRIRPHT